LAGYVWAKEFCGLPAISTKASAIVVLKTWNHPNMHSSILDPAVSPEVIFAAWLAFAACRALWHIRLCASADRSRLRATTVLRFFSPA
jgi:hypothetical protein